MPAFPIDGQQLELGKRSRPPNRVHSSYQRLQRKEVPTDVRGLTTVLSSKFALRGLCPCLICLMCVAQVFASPATFVTALPVARDQWLIRFNFQPSFGTDGFTSTQFPITNAFGITSRWALFLNLNQGFASVTEGFTPTPLVARSSGFGDTLAFVRYTLFKIDKPLSTLRIAPLVGVSIPTGSNSLRNPQGLLPGNLQLGSGTFDPYLGVTMGYNNSHWGMAADTTYRHNATAATGFAPGNTLHADAQVELVIFPPFTTRIPAEGLPKTFVISLESNYEQDGRAALDRAISPNSGGRLWKQDLILELGSLHGQMGVGAQLPVLQELPGIGRVKERLGFYVYYERYLAIPRAPRAKSAR